MTDKDNRLDFQLDHSQKKERFVIQLLKYSGSAILDNACFKSMN